MLDQGTKKQKRKRQKEKEEEKKRKKRGKGSGGEKKKEKQRRRGKKDLTPPPVQNQCVIQGIGIRRSVAEDELIVEAANSSDASQPVNLYSVNHRLTRTWFIPLSLVCTCVVPPPVCDHSQGGYFPPNRRQSIVFRVSLQQKNK